DPQLRELSRSMESRSIVSRPLGEILHREVDAFRERSGIDATLEIRGDPESLTSAQRVAVYRAIQESLSNVREHSGAATVEIRLRMRRASIEVRVTDDGHGFDVGRALARAAQRGRLGIVGIGERVRMLGGTFEIDSAPGGPTMLTFALPRVSPAQRSAFRTMAPPRNEGEGPAAGSPPQLSAPPAPTPGRAVRAVGPLTRVRCRTSIAGNQRTSRSALHGRGRSHTASKVTASPRRPPTPQRVSLPSTTHTCRASPSSTPRPIAVPV